MKPQYILCLCSLGMLFVLALLFVIEEKPKQELVDLETQEITVTYQGHGVVHPEHGTMLQGGPGKERHDHILWLGWVFGALIAVLFVTSLAFGARQNDKVGPLGKPIFIGGVIYVLIWSAMVWTYHGYMNGDTEGRFLFLPIPTALMVYAYWGFPLYFIIMYMVMFPKYIWSEETEAKFFALVEAKKNNDGGAA